MNACQRAAATIGQSAASGVLGWMLLLAAFEAAYWAEGGVLGRGVPGATPTQGGIMLMMTTPARIDRYSSAEALAQVSSAPLVVCRLIFVVTEGDRSHIEMLRDGRGDSETWIERYAIIWVARQFTHHSFPEIGRALASDHSSVLRGYARAKFLYRTSMEFRALAGTLVKKLPHHHRVQKSAREALQSVGR